MNIFQVNLIYIREQSSSVFCCYSPQSICQNHTIVVSHAKWPISMANWGQRLSKKVTKPRSARSSAAKHLIGFGVRAKSSPLGTNLNVFFLSVPRVSHNLALSAENPSAGTAYARALFLWLDQHAQGWMTKLVFISPSSMIFSKRRADSTRYLGAVCAQINWLRGWWWPPHCGVDGHKALALWKINLFIYINYSVHQLFLPVKIENTQSHSLINIMNLEIDFYDLMGDL